MNLYYGLTNYHLLCSILHKMIYLPNEKAIFIASQGVLKDRINELKKANIFDEVYYIEDKEIRDQKLNEQLSKNSSVQEIENVSQDFANEYLKIVPFDFNKINNFYIFADHGAFGLYLLIQKYKYVYLEDAKGLYSNWKNLDRILEVKDPGMRIVALHYGAYGKSNLILERYLDYSSQLKDYDLNNCENFEVNNLLDRLKDNELNKIFKLFNLKRYFAEENIALVLTQRFSTYKLLTRRRMCVYVCFAM